MEDFSKKRALENRENKEEIDSILECFKNDFNVVEELNLDRGELGFVPEFVSKEKLISVRIISDNSDSKYKSTKESGEYIVTVWYQDNFDSYPIDLELHLEESDIKGRILPEKSNYKGYVGVYSKAGKSSHQGPFYVSQDGEHGQGTDYDKLKRRLGRE